MAALRDLGVDAVGLSGVDGGLLIGQRIPELGLVAHVIGVRPGPARRPAGGGPGARHRTARAGRAGPGLQRQRRRRGGRHRRGSGARQFVLLTDVDGVHGPDGHRLATITPDEAEALIADGTIAGGMVPKVRAALGALNASGAEAIIADASVPGALLRALDEPDFGTHVVAGRPVAA